jgi:hypothetical protein
MGNKFSSGKIKFLLKDYDIVCALSFPRIKCSYILHNVLDISVCITGQI